MAAAEIRPGVNRLGNPQENNYGNYSRPIEAVFPVWRFDRQNRMTNSHGRWHPDPIKLSPVLSINKLIYKHVYDEA
jgi:hypothetical protein